MTAKTSYSVSKSSIFVAQQNLLSLKSRMCVSGLNISFTYLVVMVGEARRLAE